MIMKEAKPKFPDVETLSRSAIHSLPVNIDWGDAVLDSEIAVVEPNVEDWNAKKLLEYADYYGISVDPDISQMSRYQLIGLIEYVGFLTDHDGMSLDTLDDEIDESNCIIACRESEIDDKPLSKCSDDELRDVALLALDEDHHIGLCQVKEDIYDHMRNNFPIMNYYYPLPDLEDVCNPHEAAERIMYTNLVLMHFEDEDTYALALTGGGMDFSWDICATHMSIGYLPPVRFASDLPRMGDIYNNAFYRWVLSGCMKSVEINASWSQSAVEGVKSISKWLSEMEYKD